MKIFTSFSMFFLFVVPAFCGVIHVPGDQATIQAGINAAVDGDTVLVAENIYYENINFKGKAITVASHFILDQDTSHISKTIIDGSQPSDPDSGSVVYFISGEDTTSVLCGFTITGGTGTVRSNSTVGGGIYTYNSGALICNNIIKQNAIYSQNYQSFGGGIVCRSDTMDRKIVQILDNTITNNQARSDYQYGAYGGGIDVYGNDICIENNVISYNQVSGGDYCYGPGVRLVYTTENSIINNNTFSYNSFLNGGCHAGGLFLVITRGAKILNNYFEGNLGHWGAGLYDYASKSTFISNNIFVSNTAEYSGGGILIQQCTNNEAIQNEFIGNIATTYYGGGIYEYDCINTNIKENKIFDNSAGSGAGIETYESVNTKIINNEIIGNTANGYPGAGILVWDSHAKIVKNLISGNSTTSYGGGLAIGKSSTKSNYKTNFLPEVSLTAGAGLSGEEQVYPNHNNSAMFKKAATDSQTVLINNTITNNIAALGGGIYNEFESTLIINTILYGDSAISDPEIYNDGGKIEIFYSDIEGGWSGIGSNNIDVDPLFEDSLCHLSNSSLCIDAGNPHSAYNDPEDPINPGSALFPSMCGLRNDMGAYGGITDTIIDHITGLYDISNNNKIPKEFTLAQNYPNPFNPITNIEFQITNSEFVTLTIYNVLGQEVVILVSEKLNRGKYKYVWDASGYASGVYFYKLSTEKGISKEKKLILLR